MTETQKARRFIILILILETILVIGLILVVKKNKSDYYFDIDVTPSKENNVSNPAIPTSNTVLHTTNPTIIFDTLVISTPKVKSKVEDRVEVTYDPIVRQMPKSNIFYPTPVEMLYLNRTVPTTNYKDNTVGDNPTLKEIQSIKIDHTPSQITTYYHITIK